MKMLLLRTLALRRCVDSETDCTSLFTITLHHWQTHKKKKLNQPPSQNATNNKKKTKQNAKKQGGWGQTGTRSHVTTLHRIL
uniref:Putative secreted protein n=1 Tax=Anopheles marajoara TaxID=58244 RepID=A0A2M4CBB6_9DIPT